MRLHAAEARCDFETYGRRLQKSSLSSTAQSVALNREISER